MSYGQCPVKHEHSLVLTCDHITPFAKSFWLMAFIYKRNVYLSLTVLCTKFGVDRMQLCIFFVEHIGLDLCLEFEVNQTEGVRGVACQNVSF